MLQSSLRRRKNLKIWIINIYKKEWNLTICNSMDGPRRCYTKWSKWVGERHIPNDFLYTWNLKNNINKQTRQNQTHRCDAGTDWWLAEGRGWGAWRNRRRDWEAQVGGYRTSRGWAVRHRECVGNTVMTACAASWVQGIPGEGLREVYDWLTAEPYARN